MNERIKQISDQVWEWAENQEYSEPDQFSDIWETKFAELLVRQCMDICEQQRLKILNNPNDPSWTEHLADCQTTMEQTFLCGKL